MRACAVSLLAVLAASFVFFVNGTAPSVIYTLSLHDALPICNMCSGPWLARLRLPQLPVSFSRSACSASSEASVPRSEEHTSELQSRGHLVCRLLLEKKKRNKTGGTTKARQTYASCHTGECAA